MKTRLALVLAAFVLAGCRPAAELADESHSAGRFLLFSGTSKYRGESEPVVFKIDTKAGQTIRRGH